jgi:cyclopropane fatty-acyl-phospholipid synthase-like methyltransferase
MADYEEEDNNPLAGFWMEGDSLAPPCQAELDVVDSILDMAQPTKGSYVFDLGCGDGRIPLAAAQKYGCRSLGVEIEPKEVAKFRQSVADLHLAHLVTVVEGDLMELDLAPATVIAVYLLPEAMDALLPAFKKALKGGAKMVFNTWAPRSLVPVERRACGFSNNVDLLLFDHTSLPADDEEGDKDEGDKDEGDKDEGGK